VSAPPLLIAVLRAPERAATLGTADWDLVLRQALAANLTAGLWATLDAHGVLARVPPQPRAHLDWARRLAERHRRAVHWEVRQITAALAELRIPLILLKGAAYVLADLPASRGRLFSDIDILVPKERLTEVEGALMMHGWMSGHNDAYDQRYYREWMHELPPMQHVRRLSMIDVHHAILPETARIRPEPALLRAAAVPLAGHPGVQTLAPVDMVLHSAVHLFYDGEFDHGLRDLIDIHRLLHEFGAQPGFWEALPRRAGELQLSRPLFYALRYAVRLLGTPVPPATIDASNAGRPNGALLALMDALFGRALMPPHASCSDWATPAARFALYVRGNWLRMPPLLLARHLFHKAFISPKVEQAAH
jgi:hypothetical protein